jgi:hypothetical protein
LRRKAQVTAVNARKPKSDARLIADPSRLEDFSCWPAEGISETASIFTPRMREHVLRGIQPSRPRSLIHFHATSAHRKFVRDDIVKVIETGETGIVKNFHHDENGSIYGVQLGGSPATETALPEAALELVKSAHDDETGFAVRYIS